MILGKQDGGGMHDLDAHFRPDPSVISLIFNRPEMMRQNDKIAKAKVHKQASWKASGGILRPWPVTPTVFFAHI